MPLILALKRQRQADLSQLKSKFCSSKATERVPGQPGLHRETLTQKSQRVKGRKKKKERRIVFSSDKFSGETKQNKTLKI